MILAEDQSIAYGKFFSRAAGFVSKDFFPLFANYRRNGYDFGGVIGYLCLLDKAQKRIPYDAYTAKVSNTAQGGMKTHKSRLS